MVHKHMHLLVLTLDYDSPNLIYIVTTTVKDGRRPSETIDFSQGDTVYIYSELTNVTHYNFISKYNMYNISLNISIAYGDIIYDNFYKNFSTDDYVGLDFLWRTEDFLSNDSWPIGKYNVTIELNDYISSKNNIGYLFFNLN